MSVALPAGRPVLLVVDDEPAVCALLAEAGKRQGFEVIVCASGDAGIEVLRRRHVDLTFLDLNLPRVNGLDVLRAARGVGHATHIVLMTGLATIDSAVEAIKLGAEDYLQKPLPLARVLETMRGIALQFRNRAIVLESDAALAERLEFCGMIGRSAVILALFDLIRRIAPHARSVLIMGETGAGKELVARALHTLGPRRDRRFVTINCSAVVESLFETELFGHVRGAFTGASDHKAGLFEAAGGGTLFLDEVGELPLAVQAKLLRVLETGEVQRVGATEGKTFDVRLIAATNRDLEAAVSDGTFRRDLYYRLNVVELTVPPLRERSEDIPYLTAAFLRSHAAAFAKPIAGLTPAAEALLLTAGWPGNVRELRNVIERACLLCEGHLLTEDDIERALGSRPAPAAAVAAPRRAPLPPPPRQDVIDALQEAAGNKVAAAQRLGVSRRALYRLIEKHSIGESGS